MGRWMRRQVTQECLSKTGRSEWAATRVDFSMNLGLDLTETHTVPIMTWTSV